MRVVRFCSLLLACLALNSAVQAQDVPSAYDGHADGAVYNGKQMMPFTLYGVAIRWDRDCRRGRAERCMRLAHAYDEGAGDLTADVRVSIGYYILACRKGSGPGCARASAMLRNGAAGFTNTDLALELSQHGCSALKDQDSCAAMSAVMTASGGESAQSVAVADRACAAGSAEGCRLRANRLLAGNDASGQARAVAMFREACDKGQAWGCLGLYDAYSAGRGVAADPRQAAAAAERGCTRAAGDRLRLCALHGDTLSRAGSAETVRRGENFLVTACRGGAPEACYRLGELGMTRPAGARTNDGEAIYYWRRACDFDFAAGCRSLGQAYARATVVGRDRAVAVALADKACRLGDTGGCADARALVSADPAVRSRIPAIDPAAPAANQIALAKAVVDRGGPGAQAGLDAVARLMREWNEDAEWLLGGWLYYGLPGLIDQPNRQDGFVLIENAARVGHVDAAVWVGMAYWYGDGVAEDRRRGEGYMRVAAERGSEMAAAIYRSMRAEPTRRENERRRREAEEQARRNRADAWTRAWSRWSPSYSSVGVTPAYTGRTVGQIIDQSNWDNAIRYYSGGTGSCSSYNPYC
ncbi:tetratricopeptide repeat protein [Stakelama tenebrarum]|uniref:Sel1 repeat family protein n=1 Tax=Stakelama tenebrarum TaxID=2711215 RepID=A0A6G6Y5R2_9SPHN|nr:SEL1-like repeat protein [Sphingosinithalassobacter tenebrarum]QIG79916.1 sel1 repeat family protein [Sphingosinithalassobacter tenebrarum]